jgi:hypothetical protein
MGVLQRGTPLRVVVLNTGTQLPQNPLAGNAEAAEILKYTNAT